MRKILVVDDEPDILKVIHFRLKGAGYEITLAQDGHEALASIKVSKPDMVLLDYSMPNLKGDEVCRRIKADPETNHVIVIMLTASTNKAGEKHIADIGADGTILKPFETDELLGKLEGYFSS